MTIDEFLTELQQSQVLSEDQAARLAPIIDRGTPDSVSIAQFADELVEQRVISRFQADRLLQGAGGSLRLGNYILQEFLAEGGMGTIYRARHVKMKRDVAIKLLPPDSLDSDDSIARFEREVEAAARLSHPNVVTAHDADEDGGVHFLVMEFIDGVDLSQLVADQGPLSIATAVECILQAARGLAYVHSQRMLHRDVKPRNLMLDHDGVVKVLDVGLARLETDGGLATTSPRLTSTGAVLGTVDFMAPEQARNAQRADHRADIYGLGCTLYFLLTGRRMYRGNSLLEKINAHRKQPIPKLRESRPDAPQPLDLLFRAMVAKRPDDRPESMEEVVTHLEELQSAFDLAQQTIDTSEVRPNGSRGIKRQSSGLPASQPSKSGMTRWKPLAAATLVVGAVVLGTGYVAGWFTREPSRSTSGAADTHALGIPQQSDDSSSTTSQDVKQPATSSTHSERSAAEWVLGLGGTVKIALDDEQIQSIRAQSQLPAARFRLFEVDLSYLPITDEQLANLSQLEGIESLQLYNCSQLTGDGLRFLKDITTMKTIGLGVTQIRGRDLRHLAGNRGLEKIYMTGPSCEAEDVAVVAQFPQLTNLGFVPGDKGFESLASLEHLTALHLHGDSLPAELFETLSRLPKLSYLTITGPHSDSELSHLRRLDQLRTLIWYNARLPARSIQVVRELPRLYHLQLRGAEVVDQDVDKLIALTDLPFLTIMDTSISVSAARRLRTALPNCKLTYHGKQFDSAHRDAAEWVIGQGGMVTVKGRYGAEQANIDRPEELPAEPFYLIEINMPGSAVNDANAARFRNLFSLDHLRIANSEITNDGLAQLEDAWSLKTVDLPWSQATGDGLAHLPSSVGHLDFRGVDLTAKNVDDLLRMPGLHYLGLGNGTYHQRLGDLAEQLPLTVINIDVRGTPAEHLSGLGKSKSLKSIGLQQPHDEHLKALAGLAGIERIQTWHGTCTSEGIQSLAALPVLSGLVIARQQLDDSCVSAFSTLTSLRKLELYEVQLNAGVLERIRNALPKCEVTYLPPRAEDGGN